MEQPNPSPPLKTQAFDAKAFLSEDWTSTFGVPKTGEEQVKDPSKFDFNFNFNAMAQETVETWVRAEFRTVGHCDEISGKPRRAVDFSALRDDLHKKRPNDAQAITAVLAKLNEEFGSHTQTIEPNNMEKAIGPEMMKKEATEVVTRIEEQNVANEDPQATPAPGPTGPKSTVTNGTSRTTPMHRAPDEGLEKWVYEKYLECGFKNKNFKGYVRLTSILVQLQPKRGHEIKAVIQKLRKPGSKYSFGDINAVARSRAAAIQKKKDAEESNAGPSRQQILPADTSGGNADSNIKSRLRGAPTPATTGVGLGSSMQIEDVNVYPDALAHSTEDTKPANDDLLARKLNQLHNSDRSGITSEEDASDTDSGTEITKNSNEDDLMKESIELPNDPDYDHIDLLMPDDINDDDEDEESSGANAEIQHAPLIDERLITKECQRILPQYGFLGVHEKSKLFLNTNVPFSAFICGVQGSGKSHTTSCLLENALIPSRNLGRLENPLSALVFSYGHFSGDGAGFNISEAAFLAAAHPSFPGHPHVKKVTVLVSPSNPSIRKLYQRIPNVTVIPFKLKPRNLDIETMLTLMAVSESEEQPLYMAQVTKILRDLATYGDGNFNYVEFTKRLRMCNFNPAQTNMLRLRMDLLESFLDLKNSSPEPQFRPGEITIMDMSCPFVDANTACILFKIGLQRYVQSKAPGKMIVLDEAHKYMLKNPGAKALNDYLLQIIRLQRHFGARVIISTQEPTLLTDLIALCSITVIHRFSSPEWFAALKRHIPMSNQDHSQLLQAIECLKTGRALVYSSNAVLGKNEDGTLIKGTGKMLKVSIRKRVTSDGGQSILAV